jgi:hypothetical protein
VAAAFWLTTILSAATFDPVTQFSLTTNVAGNRWSYWGDPNTSIATYPANISLLPVLFNGSCGFGTSCWDTSSGEDNLILQNVTGLDASFPNSVAPNNALTYYTRSGIVLLRFLVPTTGTYSISGAFKGAAMTPESSEEFITIDQNVGSPLLDLTGAVPFGTSHPFSFSGLSLNAGDTVDFLVAGVSHTGDLNSISTSFTASISNSVSAVPEPGTALLGAGALALLFLAARKRA